ncbi:unnamed protein product, partial [Meganyctiphanes norvegica]
SMMATPSADDVILPGSRKPCRACSDFKSWMKAPPGIGNSASTGMGKKLGCPADSIELGRGTWRLLHSMAAYYPEKPSEETQGNMMSFIHLFSKFYPCWHCAEDFRDWLKTNTPNVSSQGALSNFFCNAHNEVNRKLGKPEFDCSLLNQRWLDGWNDGSCD